MKKIISTIMALVLAISLTACNKGENSGLKSDSSAEQQNVGQNTGSNNPVENVFRAAKSGSYATITVDASVKMDDDSAWLGLCPAGKDYITEAEADDADEIWFSVDARESESDPYVFACDFESANDGTYALVVATSDDEEVGYVAIQLEMTKSGDNLTFDFANAKLKDRPAKKS